MPKYRVDTVRADTGMETFGLLIEARMNKIWAAGYEVMSIVPRAPINGQERVMIFSRTEARRTTGGEE